MATVLLVADDRITADALRRTLAQLGHAVLPPTTSAEDAFAAIQAEPPAVVVMDMGLRGTVDGLTAGRLIETTMGTPVIDLSGYTPAQVTAEHEGPAPMFSLTKPLAEEARGVTPGLPDLARGER